LRRFIVIIFSLSMLAAAGARAETHPAVGVKIETRALADSVTVGQRLHVRYDLSFSDSLVLLPKETFDPGNCRLLSLQWRDGTPAKDERVKEADLAVIPLDLESARIPAADFLFLTPAGDTLVARSIDVEVPIRLLTSEASEARPLKPQWKAPPSYRAWYVAGAALLLAALALWAWRRRKPRAVVEPAAPELPADFVALRELARIESMNLPEAGEFKMHYTLVVDAIRRYLERRFDIEAMDRTTPEILTDLAIRRVHVDGLDVLLAEADLVKFAKYQPDISSGRRAMESARAIVIATASRPEDRPEAGAEVTPAGMPGSAGSV
jgi:hypothetical protein